MTEEQKKDDKVVISTAVEGPYDIGKATNDRNPASELVTAYIPRDSKVISVRAYIKNKPWGRGECDLGTSNWVEATLDGPEPMGWCRAFSRGQGTTSNARWVRVLFESWSHCNSRQCKLEVRYRNNAANMVGDDIVGEPLESGVLLDYSTMLAQHDKT
ncbi:MAG: hypothetical protein SVW51_10715 [Pseudomonadota bacterium]|nr:hypothetical protein [Pseudomonadota bacterium]